MTTEKRPLDLQVGVSGWPYQGQHNGVKNCITEVNGNRKVWNNYPRIMAVKGEARERREELSGFRICLYFIGFKVLNLLRDFYKDMVKTGQRINDKVIVPGEIEGNESNTQELDCLRERIRHLILWWDCMGNHYSWWNSRWRRVELKRLLSKAFSNFWNKRQRNLPHGEEAEAIHERDGKV